MCFCRYLVSLSKSVMNTRTSLSSHNGFRYGYFLFAEFGSLLLTIAAEEQNGGLLWMWLQFWACCDTIHLRRDRYEKNAD